MRPCMLWSNRVVLIVDMSSRVDFSFLRALARLIRRVGHFLTKSARLGSAFLLSWSIDSPLADSVMVLVKTSANGISVSRSNLSGYFWLTGFKGILSVRGRLVKLCARLLADTVNPFRVELSEIFIPWLGLYYPPRNLPALSSSFLSSNEETDACESELFSSTFMQVNTLKDSITAV